MKSFIESLNSGEKIKLNTIQSSSTENKKQLKDLEKQLKKIEKEYHVDYEDLKKFIITI